MRGALRRRRQRACASMLGTALAALAPLVTATACDVGPRYVRPAAPVPDAFKEASPAAYAARPPSTWQPARPEDAALKGRWWAVFREPELDALEEKLEIDNQSIAAYLENFLAARAVVSEARAGYFPTLAVGPSYSVSHPGAPAGGGAAPPAAAAAAGGPVVPGAAGPGSSSASSTSALSLPLEASWAPDLWDRIRNTVREYRYAAQVSAADLENERLTEQAALAVYYFELRGQDALAELYEHTIAADRESLELARAQAATGIGDEEAVAQAEVTLQNAIAAGTGVETHRALYEHAIATLVGRPASAFSLPVRPLSTPVPAIPVGVPSQLLERRPDIAAAERTMAQANARLGVQMAAYYPSLNLSASTGLQSFGLGTLLAAPALFWSLGASASETVFDGGLRRATVAQYRALYRADVASYRQTVLAAFQQVEDQLSTLRVLSQQIAQQEQAVQAAHRYLDLALARYRTGIDPYLNVISAQTTVLGDEQTLVTLRVTQMTAAVQLVQALGGGWDVKKLPEP